jgi:GT2 family glycosyltransferase/glycosyltransferase involved in cell wall biosynthesis
MFLSRVIRFIRREGILRFFVVLFLRTRDGILLQINKLKLRYSLIPYSSQLCKIETIQEPPAVKAHTASVDIIICVHNALDDVEQCLNSLHKQTTLPYRLILVDDGSDEETAAYLNQAAAATGAVLLRSEIATGYTYAANRGIRASSAEYIVLLNSDTIVTPDWLDRMLACLQSDQKLGIVGPLSNTASWQSVPRIEDNGDWAQNPLPEGITPARMGQLITSKSGRLFPEMPLLNGFCLLIRRKLLDEVGLFDEDNFGRGYGEEDDLILRARKSGWKMALADDVYIYHAQSKSYSSDKRRNLSDRAGKILRKKHGDEIILKGVQYCLAEPVLEGIRARASILLDRDRCVHQGQQFAGKKILFILPINTPGGGANVLRSESIAMRSMGVDVKFFNLESHRKNFLRAYPDLSQLTVFGTISDLPRLALGYDAVVATLYSSVAWLEPLRDTNERPILGYYVQGFEPLMYPEQSMGYKAALASYTLIDDMTLFSKTEWTSQQVKTHTGRECKVIGASVDIDLYRPRPRGTAKWPHAPIKIAAMVRPESPYREPFKTMELLRDASNKYKGEVEIIIFGTVFENPAFQALPHDFPWKLYGILSPQQVANLLNQVDIFVDYSSHQAMGLTAMEAMACGCAVIVPQYGGAASYANHEQNSLIIDSADYKNMWNALQRLIEDEKLRTRLQSKAIFDICSCFPEQAALNLLSMLFAVKDD